MIKWSRERLDKLVPEAHQGVVALVADGAKVQSENDLYEKVEQCGKSALILILDGVTDPHNLGACLRSADAAGVDAVVVTKDRSAGLNATVRKVACGAAETVPFFAVTNLVRCIQKLQDLGIWVVGTAGETENIVFNARFSGPLALVMGAEEKGMRRLTRENCDELVRIPMNGSVSSLNVSVATGVCLFEIMRQRSFLPPS